MLLTTLETIYQQKQQDKKKLLTLRDSYLITIYKGLIEKKSAKEIHSELYKQTINSNVKSKEMYNNAIKVLNKCYKKKPANLDKGSELLADAIFLIFTDIKADKYMTQGIYKDLNSKESEYKQKALSDEVSHNRELQDPKIFYLASSHKDCAEDHLDYQGKIYIDENWRRVIRDKELIVAISNYVREHNIKTYQWVIGRPVYMILRPNCRHFMKALPTERVLNESVNSLIKAYKTNRQVGDRQYLQTLRSDKNRKVIGEKRNAELMLEKYKERLKLHEELYSTFKSSLVRNAIIKDKTLIDRWSKYLQELN